MIFGCIKKLYQNFFKNTHNKNPTACPCGNDMGCLSWLSSNSDLYSAFVISALLWRKFYWVIIDCAIMSIYCINNPGTSAPLSLWWNSMTDLSTLLALCVGRALLNRRVVIWSFYVSLLWDLTYWAQRLDSEIWSVHNDKIQSAGLQYIHDKILIFTAPADTPSPSDEPAGLTALQTINRFPQKFLN